MIATGDERTYQWQRDGVDLYETVKFVRVNGRMLMVVTAQNDDEANYTCVVTNGAGDSVTSDAASLIVGKYRREREAKMRASAVHVDIRIYPVNIHYMASIQVDLLIL